MKEKKEEQKQTGFQNDIVDESEFYKNASNAQE